ncbi:hypothetical protein HETIRDRAFT_423326 [Heterobasidion irregulare TC 32-1]|uniref:Vesicle tethering protein Uso1/P115-like head domain-containing protein n=1 Tax=Heterobasidion irregulare (strain TC 32-1) TaxID=747525 RepID=W4JP29_HETIT|nr:uncharacterized protein HETIRDRAFT_423326 [Heterobasidion irregulare TC 32-1]ETW74646.1 hypothetical protein HETIRDRAFT_423326 [Heterobasidion irregulare TC 32-1]
MDFFSQTIVAFRGPTGAPQTPLDTIGRLSDRLSPSTLLADRRAAVLSLKGLARDHKKIVGEQALSGLLEIIQNDADVDRDIGKAALETVNFLCDVVDMESDQRELGYAHSDRVLENQRTAHKLFFLLGSQDFHVRYGACVLLTTLLHNRPQATQAYFLNAPIGPTPVVSLLGESREMMKREAVVLISAMIRQSPEIQKILAFEGIFEKLFGIIKQEGGLDGGLFIEDILKVVDTLLRYNTSNQNYFRETNIPSLLCSLLYFDPNVQLHEQVPQEFALQFWNPSKANCASLILETVGMLLGTKGTGEGPGFTRLLIEMSLASNAPTVLKVRCLTLLPANAAVLLPNIMLNPYVPVPETNGEEWDRLEPATGIDALLELVMHGEYNGLDAVSRKRDGLDLRAAAVGVFENFLREDRVKEAIVAGMVPPEDAGPSARSPMTPLLFGLILPPRSPPDRINVVSFQFATILFAHLVRHAPHCKSIARSIIPPALTSTEDVAPGGNFFVPADGAPLPQSQAELEPEELDEPQTLLQLLTEHLSLSFLSRSRDGLSDHEEREWDRVVVSYLSLLSQWLWEDPKAVREFLEGGGMSMLVEQLNQPSEIDVVIPGLCAFLLGICYEFNREPGEITRQSIYPLIQRLGADVLVGRVNRVREDERIKIVGPETWVLPSPTPKGLNPMLKPMYEGEAEMWFDWAFVDFWKSNNYTIQRGLIADPASAPSAFIAQSGEESMLVASLRDIISKQTAEIERLQSKLNELSASTTGLESERTALQDQVASLSAELAAERSKESEAEKEQEDLLVLLDELSTKRSRDKGRMREAGLEVSEDEGEEEDEDEDE